MNQLFVQKGKQLATILLCLAFFQSISAQSDITTVHKNATEYNSDTGNLNKYVLLVTDSGAMLIHLYDSTPLHRDNFIKKVSTGFYDSLLFHRVIKDFMIQGGDPTSKYAAPDALLGDGEAPEEKIPAEFKPYLFHKKGVIAAARNDNPEKASSNCQFYIVQGKQYTDAKLDTLAEKYKRIIPQGQRAIYKTLGGTPTLDQRYTVFGEVVYGLEVVDKIANTLTNAADRPLKDIRMRMKLLSAQQAAELLKTYKGKKIIDLITQ